MNIYIYCSKEGTIACWGHHTHDFSCTCVVAKYSDHVTTNTCIPCSNRQLPRWSRPRNPKLRHILRFQTWKPNWRTLRATAQINHRLHFFKVDLTSRSTTVSTSWMNRKSLRAVRTLSLISSTSAASSSMTSFALCGYSGSTTSKYGHASLFYKAVSMYGWMHIKTPPNKNSTQHIEHSLTSSGHTTYLIL